MVLNIENGTVSTIKAMDLPSGSLMPMGKRAGYARRGNGSVTLGSELPADNPQPIDKFLADAAMEKQTAILKAQSAMAERLAANQSAPAGWSTDPRGDLREAAAGARVGATRAQIAAERLARARGLVNESSPSPYATSGSPPPSMLRDIPPNAQVVVVGIYEAANKNRGSPEIERGSGVCASR